MSLFFFFIYVVEVGQSFLSRSKCLLISWLQAPSALILEPLKIKSVTVSIVSPSICHEVIGPDAIILVFWMLRFKPAFSLSSFTFIKGLFNSSLLSAISVVSSAYLRLLIFLPEILTLAWASPSSAFHTIYYASKFGKLSSGHRTGKGQFSFQSQRKAMPKNAQATTQLHSSHTLVN